MHVANFVIKMIATVQASILINGKENSDAILQNMMRQPGGWRRDATSSASNDPQGLYGNQEWASASLLEIWLQGAILGGSFWKNSEIINNWINSSLGSSEIARITGEARAEMALYYHKQYKA